MNKKEIFLLVGIIGILFLIVFIPNNKTNIPERILIKVDKEVSILNASCTADIITGDDFVNDKELEQVADIFEYISVQEFPTLSEGDYYLLETGLSKKDKVFEIEILCVDYEYISVSHVFLNNTNITCDLKEGYFIC